MPIGVSRPQRPTLLRLVLTLCYRYIFCLVLSIFLSLFSILPTILLQILIRQKERTADVRSSVKIGKLSLIDLAGSERAAVTKVLFYPLFLFPLSLVLLWPSKRLNRTAESV